MIWRVHTRAEFAALRRGRRRRQGPLTVWFAPADRDDPRPPRVAFAVGRAVGSSVHRNRLRRRLRTAARAAALHPGVYLVVAGPAALESPVPVLTDALATAARALGAPTAAR